MNTVPRPEGAGPNPPTEAEATEADFRMLLDVIVDVLDVPVGPVGTMEERHLLLTERVHAVRAAAARTSCSSSDAAEWLRSYVDEYAPLSALEVPGE